jgi:protein-S-isoprenylcysteine O-methyltransferase Ste14
MTTVYRVFSYFGLAAIFGALLHGFRHDASAPARNYLLNLLMYAVWATVHLVMTRGWFKRAVYGSAAGSLFERQVFVVISVTTWLALVWFHLPVPGVSLELPGSLHFAGRVAFILCVLMFFEGVTFPALDGLLGVPGSAMTHSHGSETPLFTEGQYAKVRHPMYRAFLFAALSSFFIHPSTAQVFWCLMLGATFVGFIPVEEAQLIAARGDAYREYMKKTPWRILPGVW